MDLSPIGLVTEKLGQELSLNELMSQFKS